MQNIVATRNLAVLILALTAALGIPRGVQAQPIPPPLKSGNLELGLFAGESHGLDQFRPMGGANIAYGLSRALFPFAEISYLPGIVREQSISTGSTTSARQFGVNMTDFHLGFHFRIPRPATKVVPYAVAGLGLIRGAQSTAAYTLVSSIGQVDHLSQTVPASVNLAFNFGGGLRVFFTERFGLRLEFKAFKPVSAPPPLDTRVFYRFAIGPVFQFR